MAMNKMVQFKHCKASTKVVFSVFVVLWLSIVVTSGFMEQSTLAEPSNNLQSVPNLFYANNTTIMLQQNEVLSSSNNREIVVPDNYATIGAAIDGASSGDTIYVKNGVYPENLVIDKSVSVIGEDSENTTVIGRGGFVGSNVFTIEADNVLISGFTIESLSYSNSSYYASGISIGVGNLASITVGEETVPSNSIGGDNCSIIGNTIVNTNWGVLCSGGGKSYLKISQNNITANIGGGIALYGGSSKTISENRIFNNTAGAGIVLSGYFDQISNNYVSGNMRGIELGSSNTVIYGNNITQNNINGLYIQTSNNIISANSIADNLIGIYLNSAFAPENNTIYHNNFVNNSQNAFNGDPYNDPSYDSQSWNDGYPSGGNYWSNYIGIDAKSGPNQNQAGSDGIGDSSMIIDAQNVDMYPLMAPVNTSNANTPPTPKPPQPVSSNNICALWHMDQIEHSNFTPDVTGNNPAILESDSQNATGFTPVLVQGKLDKALNFTDYQYLYVPVSPSLDTSGEITFDMWIKINAIENYAYNNIIVKCTRSAASELPPRIAGIAINGLAVGNGSWVPVGALRGYITTETGGFNEIATTSSVIPLSQWTHVVFTRSLATGMHLYVDGIEQNVVVTYGVQNPTGPIIRGSELYIGHGFSGVIDELSISNIAKGSSAIFFWQQWWLFAIITSGIIVTLVGIIVISRRKKANERNTSISSPHLGKKVHSTLLAPYNPEL